MHIIIRMISLVIKTFWYAFILMFVCMQVYFKFILIGSLITYNLVCVMHFIIMYDIYSIKIINICVNFNDKILTLLNVIICVNNCNKQVESRI